MNLLIDTSGSDLHVGIADGEKLLKSFNAQAMATERGVHDSRLALCVKQLFEEVGVKPAEMHRVGIVIGPGSFTGLRIGLSFVKGLWMALQQPVVAIVQHELVAEQLRAAGAQANFIVTPAYQTGLYYVADWSAPASVRLMKEADWDLPPATTLAGPAAIQSSARLHGHEFMEATIGLEELARLTEVGRPVSDVRSLEPLYVTEFVTHAGKG
jgi:tRNA threonylcarbamoyl adenosine modification protein YeaZ